MYRLLLKNKDPAQCAKVAFSILNLKFTGKDWEDLSQISNVAFSILNLKFTGKDWEDFSQTTDRVKRIKDQVLSVLNLDHVEFSVCSKLVIHLFTLTSEEITCRVNRIKHEVLPIPQIKNMDPSSRARLISTLLTLTLEQSVAWEKKFLNYTESKITDPSFLTAAK